MPDNAAIFIHFGIVLLAGLLAESIGRRTRLPRVTLLILLGVIAGPAVLGWIPTDAERWYPLIANLALGMIGFLLGGKLDRDLLVNSGRTVLSISLTHVCVTYGMVAIAMLLVGLPLPLALLFAAIATATDPAATNDVIQESGARGPFSDALVGVVAIDDAWGLIVFSLSLVAAQMLLLGSFDSGLVMAGAWELGGAVLLGLALGVPMAFLSGRIRENQPILVEALGAVILCVGLALYLHVSYLLSCVVLGVVVTNLARHHEMPFHAIEDIEWPVMIVFFVLSGALLGLADLAAAGWICVIYVGARTLGRLLGGWLAAYLPWVDGVAARWSGLAMMPQAGVALAMGFVAVQVFPAYAEILLPVIVASTVIFELLGPIMARYSLAKVGEARPAR